MACLLWVLYGGGAGRPFEVEESAIMTRKEQLRRHVAARSVSWMR
jgi:hypothetical protein